MRVSTRVSLGGERLWQSQREPRSLRELRRGQSVATRVEVHIEDQTYYKCSDCESTLAYSDNKCPNCNKSIVGTDKRGR